MHVSTLKRGGWLFLGTVLLGATFGAVPPLSHPVFAKPSASQTPGASKPAPTIDPVPTKLQGQHLTEETAGLLVRSLRVFFNPTQIETTQQLQIEGMLGAILVRMVGQSRSIIKAPSSFRTEFAFQDPSLPTQPFRQFLLISNGKTLWMYRSDTQQYSTQPYQALFTQPVVRLLNPTSGETPSIPPASLPSNLSLLALGVLPNLYLTLREQALPALGNSSSSASDMVQLILNRADVKQVLQFQGYKSFENQGNFAVYSLNIKNLPTLAKPAGSQSGDLADPYLELWVNPQTEQLTRLHIGFQFASQNMRLRIQFQENTLQQRILATIPPDTFYFIPPKGARRLKSLSINPF